MRYLDLLSESVIHLNSPNFKAWFGNSKVVDDQGNPQPVYHGTRRPDRVANRFQKARATAGPMAYFTDDSEIASNYAQAKPDTSVESDSYNDWFKVKIGRSVYNLDRVWYLLPSEEKQRISELAPKVRTEEDDEIYLDEDNTNGPGNYDYTIKQHRGNVLATLLDCWCMSGLLFDQEQEFLKVLKLAGMTTPVIYDHPNASHPYVYKVYLSIQNPLVSTNIPQNVLDALSKGAGLQRVKTSGGYEYQWDKKTSDARAWMRDLLDDIEKNGGVQSWTVIPDWVTKILISLGYDGIKDVGGKRGGMGHTVWVPFDEHQVKSAISNKGSFDPNKRTIDS